jgi:hypothetical protein
LVEDAGEAGESFDVDGEDAGVLGSGCELGG